MTAPLREDVSNYFDGCGKAFAQLAAILKTIEDEAGDNRRLLALAGAGRYIADDMGNLAGCYRDEIEEYGIRTD